MNKKYENEKRYGLEITWDPNHYNPIIHGTVEVIRIFYSENTTRNILAELRFCFGGTTIIEWTNPDEREKFADGIDGYTLFLDERVVVDNYKAGELLSDKNISDYAKMRLKESEGILKTQLKRKEYQMDQLNDEYNDAIKIYKGYQKRILATKGVIDYNLAVMSENFSNHVNNSHRRLKAAEEAYDNTMKELIIIQEKLSSAKKNKEETNMNSLEHLKDNETLLSDKMNNVDHEIKEAWKKYYKNRIRYHKFLIGKDPSALISPFKAHHYAKRVLNNILENKIAEKARIQHDLDEIQYLLKHNDVEDIELLMKGDELA